jgi:pyruvate/2-oxoglutarate dehydrogenase complex dihydrolipoamide acyltransferase (E2) component
MAPQKQESDVKSEELVDSVHFREITRRSTGPIELLNNLAPKNRIYGLVEIDVTEARKFISENEAKTGEKLSFTAWVIKCIAQAISEHREIQAFKKGKMKLIIFDDVDIGIIIERQVKSEKFPTQYVIRKANEKNFRQIHDEIRKAQKSDTNGHIVAGEGIPTSVSVFLRLPGPLRKPFWWKVRSDPFLRKRLMGTVGVTALGMFGKGGGWAIPIGLHHVVFALGGISRKPKDMTNPVDVGEYLSMTVMFDEEVSFGAPATRFITRLSELMQVGFGLE